MSHTWLEISQSALKHNLTWFRSLIGPERKLMAVIKANAYGHGLIEVAQTIEDEVDYFAVANTDEAYALRKAGLTRPILVLAYFPKDREVVEWAIKERVELPITNFEQAKQVSRLVRDGELRIHVKVDTGMGRLGILAREIDTAAAEIKQINELPNLHIKGIFSHLADPFGNISYTKEQLSSFAELHRALTKQGFDSQLYHLAKTTAILTLPDSYYDAVRLGIGLYGIWPALELKQWLRKEHPDFTLKPVLTWKAKITQIKDYPAESYIGYGCTFKTHRKTRIAIIPVGYYEGFDRGLSNKGEVLIRGQRCPVLGLVCMNMTIVDVTDAGRVSEEDEVVLMGQQGDEEITARDVAELAKTINYEVVTRINPLIPRVIID